MGKAACRHVMLVFLSDLKARSLDQLKHYDILGKKIDCRQTNESAVLYMQGYLTAKGESLDRIFMICSDIVCQPIQNEVGDIVAPSARDIFEEAVIGKYPELEGRFQPVPYKDGPVRECMLQVASMAEEIKDYCRQLNENWVCLHADMTGGFRHATMMMMSIMQLLTYSERSLSKQGDTSITIGKVLYSLLQQNAGRKGYMTGRIEDATDIHRMYNLIAGVEEFAQYGSVEAIQRYFQAIGREKLSPALGQLLATMQDFSDAIRLCRSDMIRAALHDLQRHIRVFRDMPGKDVSEQLFARMIVRVEEDYHEVVREGATELDVIDWCLRKGFLQQALTFCTDRLPMYLVDRGICAPADEAKAATMADEAHPHWQQNFIIRDKIPLEKTDDKKQKAKQDLYRVFLDIQTAQKREMQVDLEQMGIPQAPFEQLLEDISYADQLLNTLRREMLCKNQRYPLEFMGKHTGFSRLLRFLYYAKTDDGQSYERFISSTISRERICHILMDESRVEDYAFNDRACVLFKALARNGKKKKSKTKAVIKTKKEKWQMREDYWRQAFCDGRVITNYASQMEDVIHILQNYNDIRNVRNLINHASEGEGSVEDRLEVSRLSAHHIEQLLRDCLDAIRALEKGAGVSKASGGNVFVNHTNHCAAAWEPVQRQAAESYGTVKEVPFPVIPSVWGEAEVYKLAVENAARIAALHPAAVLCQGEFSYTAAMIQLLKQSGITVLAACSERQVHEYLDKEGHMIKESHFVFTRFREY